MSIDEINFNSKRQYVFKSKQVYFSEVISDRPLIWKIGKKGLISNSSMILGNNENIKISNMDYIEIQNASRSDSNIYR